MSSPYRVVNRRRPQRRWLVFVGPLVLLVLLGVLVYATQNEEETVVAQTRSLSTTTAASNNMSNSAGVKQQSSTKNVTPVRVLTRFVDNPVAEKQRKDLESSPAVNTLTVVTMEKETELLQQPDMQACGDGVEVRHAEFLQAEMPHFAHELFKYCWLTVYGGLYLDAESPLLLNVQDLLAQYPSSSNLAVLGDSAVFSETIHGSLLLLRQPSSPVAKGMLHILTDTPTRTLDASPLLIPQALYNLVLQQQQQQQQSDAKSLSPGSNGKNDGWYLFQQSCTVNPLTTTTPLMRETTLSKAGSIPRRLTHHCPMHSGYCCHAFDSNTDLQHSVVLMTKHPLLPYQLLPSTLPRPYNAEAGHYQQDELPFIATITEKVMPRPETPPVTPNFFETLMQNNCLPSDQKCSNCLRNKEGSNCEKCKKECPCFCKTLCRVTVDEKFVSKQLTVRPPLYAKDPTRIVPRIIHQTWFEEVNKEKYPNMSRLIESFRQSGWEYKFYTDDVAANFLSTHFPPEVREAYEALRPGAFKADLFRYCVLLIHGGFYADMDVMLESNLDAAVSPDIGFMVPIDEPGKPVGHRMCLWNGLIAAAPGHPFMAHVIETVVNHIRNRFTSVDIDAEFCPNPELSVLHAFDTLFTAGPCILGATLNRVLGRPGQEQFEAGEIHPWRNETAKAGGPLELRLPGRTVILHQNKWDMGAHRFTLLDKNIVVAATDMPDYDDRKQLEDNEHYSKTHVKTGVYGVEKLYTDNKKANENIRISVDASGDQHKKATSA